MQTVQDTLLQILHVVGKIEQNQGRAQQKAGSQNTAGGGTGSISSMLGPAVKSFAGVKAGSTKAFFNFLKGMISIARDSKEKDVKKTKILAESISAMGDSLPSIAKGLKSLGGIRTVRVRMAVSGLQLLYNFMEESGETRRVNKVKRAIKIFEKMGKALKRISKPIKDITMGFTYLALGILALAGSLLLTSKLLKLAKPTDVLIFLGALIIGVVIMFGILALARRAVDRGTDTIKDIGLGMLALGLGIVAFAFTLKYLPVILGNESGGSIAKSLFLMFSIVAVSVAMFALIGAAAGPIKKGVGVVFLMTLGMLAISAGMIGLATAAKYLMGGALTVGSQDMATDEKDDNKKAIRRGLGTIGLILLASVALFALLGIPVVAGLVMLGSVTAIAMSVALILLAKSISKLVKVGKDLEGENIAKNISHLIGGALEGFLGGISVLAGGKTGIKGIAEFIKNRTKIFAGIGVVKAMAGALSQFAKAISAFAELENMRIIEGYDKDGKPIFGAKVNVTQVGQNITTTISSFLKGLIESTDGLTKRQAGAIKKMGRALTGKRGILSAVIQFASALKMYAEFGESNEIGYVEYDEDGKEIHKKVAASVVVDNMIGSFLYFTDKLFSRSEEEFGDGEPGISGRQKRRMKRMSKALVGRNGILGAVMQFSETLQLFSKFGVNNELPILDEDGKPTGETISVEDIADNIVKALTTFSDTLATKLEKGKSKDAGKALDKYDKMINKLSKLSSAITGLDKVGASIQSLADGIGDLAINIERLDTDKLSGLTGGITISGAPTSAQSGVYSAPQVAAGRRKETDTTTKAGEPKWDVIAAQIGEAVGSQIVSAMKSGQMKFQFSGNNEGVVEYG